MKKNSSLLLFIPLFFLTVSCGGNDAQDSFEREAYRLAENITRTNYQGDVDPDHIDNDDWRVSPFYTGIADIDPVFPNPVPYVDNATLEVYINGSPLSSYLELFYIDDSGRPVQLEVQESVGDFTLNTFRINPIQFGANADLAKGIYRLILIDGNQRIITYGDIMIE